METLGGLAVRATATYVVLLVLLRLSGKRTIKEGTPFDFVVAIIVGDFPDDLIWGEVPVAQGFVAMGTIVLLHVVVASAAHRSARIARLVCPTASTVIRDGTPVAPTLAREHLSEAELAMLVRHHGLPDARQIREARLEPSSHLTVTRHDGDRPAEGRDRDRLNALAA
jgi:uncharacterized membrane protein YcaP (DUF421 family)